VQLESILFWMHAYIIIEAGASMRTTVTIDDELYSKALELADPAMDKADLISEGMKTFVLQSA
jgi:Arc/MetJ family transcription regulator